ncbi:hypothetical protein VYI20_00550 [Streptococcus anginosus]|uniref:hypothetical protein n=1 Tax=Streptococcus anginosus TaxID=1328 RepID=UPI00079BAA3A|nr:hypothetical protein [Streptococcus anginosus]KXU01861.1 hypothetical protein SCODD09_00953 [Streptococcus constellatus]MDX5016102.1 hypothetical protein [Streptococcus anginosus]MDX5020479.1 hypothetical protein [Streptococcus anginosus]MED5763558.1 hypothetical protein [Streptococcus anginosus]MED5906173.1 hypothetical protein [Streptococcus anginosus]
MTTIEKKKKELVTIQKKLAALKQKAKHLESKEKDLTTQIRLLEWEETSNFLVEHHMTMEEMKRLVEDNRRNEVIDNVSNDRSIQGEE